MVRDWADGARLGNMGQIAFRLRDRTGIGQFYAFGPLAHRRSPHELGRLAGGVGTASTIEARPTRFERVRPIRETATAPTTCGPRPCWAPSGDRRSGGSSARLSRGTRQGAWAMESVAAHKSGFDFLRPIGHDRWTKEHYPRPVQLGGTGGPASAIRYRSARADAAGAGAR